MSPSLFWNPKPGLKQDIHKVQLTETYILLYFIFFWDQIHTFQVRLST